MSADWLLAHNVDVEGRRIVLGGEVNEGMYLDLRLGLLHLGPGPITVELTTYGGDAALSIAMHDLIKSHGAVTTFAIGVCMSAGAIILQAGLYRFAHPDCNIMVHHGQETNDSGTEARVTNAVRARIKQIFRERTGKSARIVNKWHAADTHFTAADALKAGLIDGVVG